MSAGSLLYTVCDCPASPGAGVVIVLKSFATGELVYFAPCCGIAWLTPPLDGRLDVILALDDIAPGGVEVATLADLSAAGVEGLIKGTEPLQRWQDDIPSFLDP